MTTTLTNTAASTGSACHAESIELSPVLKAMGISTEIGMGAVRFSLGRSTRQTEIQYVIEQIKHAIRSSPKSAVNSDSVGFGFLI